jgi:hypothetical protein
VNKGKTTRAEALLWSVILGVIITGAVHAAAMILPDWLSSRNAKQSALEAAVARISEFWLMNALWLGGGLIFLASVLAFALLAWRLKFSNQRGSGVE